MTLTKKSSKHDTELSFSHTQKTVCGSIFHSDFPHMHPCLSNLTLTCQFFPIYHREALKLWLVMVTRRFFQLKCYDFLSCCSGILLIHLGCLWTGSNFRSFWVLWVHAAFLLLSLFLPLQVSSQEWGFLVMA